MKNGKFIVIEGLDGCGKTTQTHLLADRLNALGYNTFITNEPTTGDTGKLLRKILSGNVKADNLEMTVLFSADRIYHNVSENGIAEHIGNGDIVICDRYYYSTFAYQGLDGNLDFCKHLNLDCPSIRKPDLCIFLSMDTDKCLERIHTGRTADEIEIFENKKTLDGIKKRFESVFSSLENENIKITDASGSIEEVGDRIFSEVEKLL